MGLDVDSFLLQPHTLRSSQSTGRTQSLLTRGEERKEGTALFKTTGHAAIETCSEPPVQKEKGALDGFKVQLILFIYTSSVS